MVLIRNYLTQFNKLTFSQPLHNNNFRLILVTDKKFPDVAKSNGVAIGYSGHVISCYWLTIYRDDVHTYVALTFLLRRVRKMAQRTNEKKM